MALLGYSLGQEGGFRNLEDSDRVLARDRGEIAQKFIQAIVGRQVVK